jgi:hypothetical protein
MKQEKLDRVMGEVSMPTEGTPPKKPKHKSGRLIDINVADFKGHPLWDILRESVHSNPRYSNLRGYIRKHVLPDNPEIRARELASKLSITVGEALIILHDDEPE